MSSVRRQNTINFSSGGRVRRLSKEPEQGGREFHNVMQGSPRDQVKIKFVKGFKPLTDLKQYALAVLDKLK